MMTFRQNVIIVSRRLNKRFGKYFWSVLLFSVFGLLGALFSSLAESWFTAKNGMSTTEITTYYLQYLAYGDEFFTMYPEAPVITYDVYTMTVEYANAVSLIKSAISLIGGLFFGLPSAQLFLTLIRNEQSSLKASLKFVGKSIPLSLLRMLKILLWSLLFIVPGVIKAISYSQCYYVKLDNPDMKANECLRRSEEIMRGRKGKYFGMYILYEIASYAASYVASYVLVLLFSVIQTGVAMPEITSYALLAIATLLTFAASTVVDVYLRGSYAVFYEDAKRSWLDDVEKDLRFSHESGNDGGSPFDNSAHPANDQNDKNDDPFA